MKAIVFDLFHTLIDPEDHRPKDFRRSEHVADALGIERDPFWDWWRETAYPRVTGVTHLVDEVAAYALGQGVKTSPEEIDRAVSESARYQRKAMEAPRAEVLRALEDLRGEGMKLGLLSNVEEWELRGFKSTPLWPLMDAASFSYEIGSVKPELEAYVNILRKLDADPTDTAYVANGWDDELEGARNAGFGLVVFMRGFVGSNGLSDPDELRQLASQADETIDDLGELLNL